MAKKDQCQLHKRIAFILCVRPTPKKKDKAGTPPSHRKVHKAKKMTASTSSWTGCSPPSLRS